MRTVVVRLIANLIFDLITEPRIHERYDYTTDYYNPHVRHLIIPSGVKSISAEFFRYGCVDEHIEFPDTLISIGEDAHGCAFANSCLPDVVIPDSLKNIGVFAFGHSVIKSVRFPLGLRCEKWRCMLVILKCMAILMRCTMLIKLYMVI